MTNARDKANIPVLNFQSKGIDDNADATAITINSSEQVGIGTTSPDGILHLDDGATTKLIIEKDGGGAGSLIFHNDGSQTSYIQLDASEDMVHYGGSGVNQIFYASGSERMRLTSTGLGIGTSSPTEKLVVNGRIIIDGDGSGNNHGTLIIDGSATSSSQIRFYQNGTPKGYVTYWDSSDTLGLTDGSANGLHFSPSTQRVGIGTTSPDDKFHVMRGDSGGTAVGGSVITAENSGNCFVTFLGTNAANCTLFFGDNNNNNAGQLDYDHANDSMSFFTNQSERMRITDAGRIGIGSSSPGTNDAVLIENGQSYLTIKDAQQMGIKLYGDDTNVLLSYDKTTGSLTGGIMFAHADGHTEFKTGGNNTRMTIKSDGNVGIGLTAPDSKLHVVNGSGQAAKIHSDTNNSGDLGMSVLAGQDSATNSGDCKWIRLADGNDSGKAYIQFKGSGPNAEFAAVSDERLKTNIQDTDVVGLDVINNLRLVKFDWNETATQDAGWSMTGHQKLGFIAQEVEQILPEFISEDTNGFKIMGDSGFVPYLIKALQEQQTKIQELEARITTLEANNP
nr:endosialidase [uncultured Mediterranean phage uvMED]